jgi:hypothetical protein
LISDQGLFQISLLKPSASGTIYNRSLILALQAQHLLLWHKNYYSYRLRAVENSYQRAQSDGIHQRALLCKAYRVATYGVYLGSGGAWVGCYSVAVSHLTATIIAIGVSIIA